MKLVFLFFFTFFCGLEPRMSGALCTLCGKSKVSLLVDDQRSHSSHLTALMISTSAIILPVFFFYFFYFSSKQMSFLESDKSTLIYTFSKKLLRAHFFNFVDAHSFVHIRLSVMPKKAFKRCWTISVSQKKENPLFCSVPDRWKTYKTDVGNRA